MFNRIMRCDPRPPRTAAAAFRNRDRPARSTTLRSSAAADGGRCAVRELDLSVVDLVAILGRRGRRPLPTAPS